MLKSFSRINRQLNQLEAEFTDLAVGLSGRPKVRDWLTLEGIASSTWQVWGGFCRELLIESSIGCRTRGGVTITPVVSPQRWERVSYISTCVVSKGNIRTGRTNSELRREMTWGDTDLIIDYVSKVNPTNQKQILDSIALANQSAKHLQTVRNTLAHISFETIAGLKKLQPFYNDVAMRHPADALLWTDPTTRDFCYLSWIDAFRKFASAATA